MVFQIESICSQNTDHDILNCLADLPRGLSATFQRILRRFQCSNVANVDIGRRIFKLVAAACRPLTLDELAEALSVIPGDISWDESRMINDVWKSLESCGSLIVVDEEYSTVHFAHSSVRSHLLAAPTETEDVRGYHVDLTRADMVLGAIAVTYLNLDILDAQLVRASKPSQDLIANVPSTVIRSAIPKHVNKTALALLSSRRATVHKASHMTPDIARALVPDRQQMKQHFHFLSYSREHWLYHTHFVHRLGKQTA